MKKGSDRFSFPFLMTPVAIRDEPERLRWGERKRQKVAKLDRHGKKFDMHIAFVLNFHHTFEVAVG